MEIQSTKMDTVQQWTAFACYVDVLHYCWTSKKKSYNTVLKNSRSMDVSTINPSEILAI
jgi:hypothetical protein